MQVWRTLPDEDLYPYHDQRVQHLEPGDHAQRMDFCHWIKAHPELLSVILFSDEASFTRDGVNNSRNVHTWSHDNPHETRVTNFQRRFSVNVWCGVIGNRLIGPFVFDNNLTGNTYEAFLKPSRQHCFCHSDPVETCWELLINWWRTLRTATVKQQWIVKLPPHPTQVK